MERLIAEMERMVKEKYVFEYRDHSMLKALLGSIAISAILMQVAEAKILLAQNSLQVKGVPMKS